MKNLLHLFLDFKTIFFSITLIVSTGVVGGFLGATLMLMVVLIFINPRFKTEILFVLLLITFFLCDNTRGGLSFSQNFRFVVLGFSIFYLLKDKLIINNLGNSMLPFTVVAILITLVFSPVGMIAVLRALSFWLVALVIFKFFKVSYQKNNKKLFDLLVVTIALYLIATFVFLLLPLGYLNGRFKGLMGNPNGLGLLCIFLYALISIISYRRETNFSKLFLRILTGIILIFIVLTGSRTALFSVLVYQVSLKLNKGIILPIIFTLLYFLISVTDVTIIIENLGLDQYLRVDSIRDASGRTEVWPVAWEEIKNNPVFGRGIMYDNYFINNYVKLNIGDNISRHWAAVWSSYFSLLLDVGIIGSLLYAHFYKKMYNKALFKNQAIAFILLCCLSGITESWMAASMNPFTPMMFLYWAIQTQPINKIQ